MKHTPPPPSADFLPTINRTGPDIWHRMSAFITPKDTNATFHANENICRARRGESCNTSKEAMFVPHLRTGGFQGVVKRGGDVSIPAALHGRLHAAGKYSAGLKGGVLLMEEE